MIYHITYKNNRKYATPVNNREEFLALRNSKDNLENLAKARAGDSEAKGRLVQFAYNLGHVEGALAATFFMILIATTRSKAMLSASR